MMGISLLDRVCSVKDLGVTLDRKMTFNEHITSVTANAFATIGFIRRNTTAFKDIHALKALYSALVRSQLEYAAQVWAPYHNVHIARLERVQRAFVRLALRTLPWRNPPEQTSIEDRRRLLGLDTLLKRRQRMQQLDVRLNCQDRLFTLCSLRFETSYGVEVAENDLIDARVPNCKKVVAGGCGVVAPLSIYLVEFAETAGHRRECHIADSKILRAAQDATDHMASTSKNPQCSYCHHAKLQLFHSSSSSANPMATLDTTPTDANATPPLTFRDGGGNFPSAVSSTLSQLRFRQAFNQELAAVQCANTTPNRIKGGRAEDRGDESPAVLERPAMKTNCSSGRTLRGKAFYRTILYSRF
ncbi:hypothetical protein quinque_013886 [Culex quinquefasciatus]